MRLPSVRVIRLVIIAFTLLWAVGSFGAAHAQDLPEALGSISGSVRNQQGDPLSGILVTVEHYTYAYPSRYITTNDQGQFSFLSLAPGAYRLAFYDAKGEYAFAYYLDGAFAEQAQLITVQGSAVNGIEMTLALGGSLAVEIDTPMPITGTIGASISARLARQNRNGQWVYYGTPYWDPDFEGVLARALPEGDYKLCVSIWLNELLQEIHECYDNKLPASPSDIPDDAEPIAIASGTATTLTMAMGDIHQLSGVVLSPQGEPITNALVEVRGPFVEPYPGPGYPGGAYRYTTTDEEGRWSFYYLGKGKYQVLFRAPEYVTSLYNQAYTPQEATLLEIDATSRLELTATMLPSAHITGKALLAGGGPVDYPTITLERYLPASDSWLFYQNCIEPNCISYNYEPITGAYTVTNLLAGTYRLGVWAPLGANLSASEVVTLTLAAGESRPNVNFVLGVGEFDGKIRGTVTANGLPQAGIEVGLFNTGGQTQLPLVFVSTDAEGNYELKGLARGFYVVGFRDPRGRYATTFFDNTTSFLEAKTIEISGTLAVENVNAALTLGATIRGRVHSLDRRAAAGYPIVAMAADLSFYVAYLNEFTDGQGFYEITGLPGGSYLVMATVPNGSVVIDPTRYQVYYPSALVPTSAGKVTVEAGQAVEGIDIWYDNTPGARLPYIGSKR